MRYSIEPRDRIYVKVCEFLSFTKNIGKNLSNKYSQKFIDTATKSASNATKIASQRPIQKTAEATGDLIGNKIAHQITSISKKLVKELPIIDEYAEITTHRKKYISLEERQQIIDELRLVP